MVRPFQKPSRRIFILVVSLGGILAAGLMEIMSIYHNTCLQQGDIVAGPVPGTRHFVFRDNVTNYGTYGMNFVTS